jgi:hypothetical protein
MDGVRRDILQQFVGMFNSGITRRDWELLLVDD